MLILFLGLAAFGVDFNTLNEGDTNEYYQAYKLVLDNGRQIFRKTSALIKMFIPFLPSTKKLLEAQKKLFSLTGDIIEQRRKGNGDKIYLIDMMLGGELTRTQVCFRKNITHFHSNRKFR